jgi:hypothetical protein
MRGHPGRSDIAGLYAVGEGQARSPDERVRLRQARTSRIVDNREGTVNLLSEDRKGGVLPALRGSCDTADLSP